MIAGAANSAQHSPEMSAWVHGTPNQHGPGHLRFSSKEPHQKTAWTAISAGLNAINDVAAMELS